MAARSREITTLSLADLGIDPAAVGTTGATTRVVDARAPQARDATRVVRGPADEAARQVVDFLAERRII
jgi:electron transfer flavoprotein beta subunit